MYHIQIGSTDWAATAAVLEEIEGGLAERGHGVRPLRADAVARDERARSPSAARLHKETGPGAAAVRVAQAGRGRRHPAAPRRLHDRHAGRLRELAGGADGGRHHHRQPRPVLVVRAARRPGRHPGDGGGDPRDRPARGVPRARRRSCTPTSRTASRCRPSHYGSYVGWAALELYVVETLCGARLAHSYGGLIDVPWHRAAIHLALDDLHGRDSIGSMVYGNTVDMRPRDRAHNLAVLSAYRARRHRLPAAPPDRPRRARRAADRGRARPERRRERRGADDRARARARGAPVGRPVRLARAWSGSAPTWPSTASGSATARSPACARTASTSPTRRACCSRCAGSAWAASSSAST